MKQNKLFSAAIALCMIAIFMMSWMPLPQSGVVSNSLSFAKPTPVWLTTTTTGGNPNVRTGTFIASPELGTSGTYVMNIQYFGQAFHCTTTFSPTGGDEFTLFSECQKTLFTGQWQAASGTGIYANLRGNGSIVMGHGHEMVTGRVF
jgi:hypothetical protein